jgi:predicted GNAT family acetyltransferase
MESKMKQLKKIQINHLKYDYIICDSTGLQEHFSDSDLKKSMETLMRQNRNPKSKFEDLLSESSRTKYSTLFFIFILGKEVVSTCRSVSSETNSRLNFVQTSKSFRRRGMCSNLIQRVVKFLEISGIKMISLGVMKSNVPAIRCYQKVGFEVTSERKNVLGEQEYKMRMIFQN